MVTQVCDVMQHCSASDTNHSGRHAAAHMHHNDAFLSQQTSLGPGWGISASSTSATAEKESPVRFATRRLYTAGSCCCCSPVTVICVVLLEPAAGVTAALRADRGGLQCAAVLQGDTADHRLQERAEDVEACMAAV
jgi:hypothetical protein